VKRAPEGGRRIIVRVFVIFGPLWVVVTEETGRSFGRRISRLADEMAMLGQRETEDNQPDITPAAV
jgi:hypothetical protein